LLRFANNRNDQHNYQYRVSPNQHRKNFIEDAHL